MKIQDLKVGDIFFSEGLTPNGDSIQTKCKLLSYNGMNKYVIENRGITILVDGDDKITQ